MPRIFLVASGAVLTFSLAVAGCQSGASDQVTSPVGSIEPTATATKDAAALAQAQEWLDAANLPPGAVRTDTPPASFNSYQDWPCGPYEELEGYWVIAGTTVAEAANWMIQNPTADLMTTHVGLVPEDGVSFDGATVGYVPAADSQEGIVYTVARTGDGVAVKAEVAAQTDTATCPELPHGESYGAPGQG